MLPASRSSGEAGTMRKLLPSKASSGICKSPRECGRVISDAGSGRWGHPGDSGHVTTLCSLPGEDPVRIQQSETHKRVLIGTRPCWNPDPRFPVNSLALSLLYGPTLTSLHDCWKNHSFDYRDLCWHSVLCPRSPLSSL